MDNYGYIGINFPQDPDLVLPDDEDWDASLGKKHVLSFDAVIFICFMDFIVFLVYVITNIPLMMCRSCADMTSGDVPDTAQGCIKDGSGVDWHNRERACGFP